MVNMASVLMNKNVIFSPENCVSINVFLIFVLHFFKPTSELRCM